MLIEEKGAKMLIDPGTFTESIYATLSGLDAILITHEHADHFHIPSLRILLRMNPKALVICNPGVARILVSETIEHTIVGDKQMAQIKGVQIDGYGSVHATVHSTMPLAENTGFLIGGRFWFPGDAFVEPGVPTPILALPVAGPWMKISEALDYALKLNPDACFPVHDAILSDIGMSIHHRIAGAVLEPRGIRFFALELNKEYEF